MSQQRFWTNTEYVTRYTDAWTISLESRSFVHPFKLNTVSGGVREPDGKQPSTPRNARMGNLYIPKSLTDQRTLTMRCTVCPANAHTHTHTHTHNHTQKKQYICTDTRQHTHKHTHSWTMPQQLQVLSADYVDFGLRSTHGTLSFYGTQKPQTEWTTIYCRWR